MAESSNVVSAETKLLSKVTDPYLAEKQIDTAETVQIVVFGAKTKIDFIGLNLKHIILLSNKPKYIVLMLLTYIKNISETFTSALYMEYIYRQETKLLLRNLCRRRCVFRSLVCLSIIPLLLA